MLSPIQTQAQASYDEWVNSPCKFNALTLLDSAVVLECIYDFTEIDNVLEQARTHELILQIGKNVTRQTDFKDYLCDSIFKSRNYQMTWKESMAVSDSIKRTLYREYVRRADTIWDLDVIAMSLLEYTDSCVRFDWQLHNDTLTVCGYTCRKAVANFRGRTWTAWYTEQIPIDAGPWKLHGLPGLILKASDQNFQHDFEAVAVRKPHVNQIAQKVSNLLNKVSRKRFREMEYNAAVNFAGEMEKTGLIQSSSSDSRRMFYSPLELE